MGFGYHMWAPRVYTATEKNLFSRYFQYTGSVCVYIYVFKGEKKSWKFKQLFPIVI